MGDLPSEQTSSASGTIRSARQTTTTRWVHGETDLATALDATATAAPSPSPVTEDATPAFSSPATPAPASTDVDAAPATGSTDVSAALTDGRPTLSREVLSDDHRSTLVSAAVGVVGTARPWTVQLTDAALTIDATVPWS